MGRKDRNHYLVLEMMQAAGWKVIRDPYYIYWGGHKLEIDALISKYYEAEGKEILLEIKSMDENNYTGKYYNTLGQYLAYLDSLELRKKNYDIYLTIDKYTYDMLTKDKVSINLLKKHTVKFKYMVYNEFTRRIIEWNPPIL